MAGLAGLGEQVVWLRRNWPAIAFIALLVLPLYALVITVVVRSGLWDLSGEPFNDEQFKALFLFLGAALGTTATVIGLLLTRASAERSLAQQQLDTAVQALSLIKNETDYAAKGVVSGALATVVHLGHPVIAMRTLQTALRDDAVDINTAVWLIDRVLVAAPAPARRDVVLVASKQEAVELLHTNLERLIDDNKPGDVEWPLSAHSAWPRDLSQQTGWRLMQALMELLTSRPAHWWTQTFTWSWVIYTLNQLVQDDTVDTVLRTEAAGYGLLLLTAHDGDVNGLTDTAPRAEVEARLRALAGDVRQLEHRVLADKIEEWVDEALAASPPT
jgi:hypothetical protein